MIKSFTLAFYLLLLMVATTSAAELRATGDLGVVIEREHGSVLLINTSQKKILSRIEGFGDLSHASVVFSRDQRYAYVFGRDGGLSKIDLLLDRIDKRIIQAGNSIGGAISQDGRLIAVSNYTPGGIKVFASDTLEQVANIPALYGDNQLSKVVGLVDAPGQQFIFSLFDAGEIWLADVKKPHNPTLQKFKQIGKQPYDALLTPDGRYYIAGLFGDNGLSVLDLWDSQKGVTRILQDYGQSDEKLPVYKMPHLEGWAVADDFMFVPAMGRHEILVVNRHHWQLVKRIAVQGQPVFAMARPDGRHVWVNFALPNNNALQVIDVRSLTTIKTLNPGKAVLHMEFSPRGEEVWVSVRDDNRIIVYDTGSFAETASLKANKPSGIFFSARAYTLGL